MGETAMRLGRVMPRKGRGSNKNAKWKVLSWWAGSLLMRGVGCGVRVPPVIARAAGRPTQSKIGIVWGTRMRAPRVNCSCDGKTHTIQNRDCVGYPAGYSRYY